MNRTLESVFVGPDSKLRAFWRALLFYLLVTRLLFPLLEWPFQQAAGALKLSPGLTAGNILVGEIANLATALVCTAVFARYERRRIDSYGLPLDRAFSRQTFEGAAAGIVMAGAVALAMLALGGIEINGLAGSGSALALSAVAWLVANICIGVAEELLYRSYLLQTLWKSIGFWPAAIVIALVFAADHYFYKAGENIWDVITLVSLSLLLSYTVLRMGTLWFAVGFHAAFDYMQLFVIGTPNGAQVPVGRLLDARFDGPAWLTGGVLGTEASFLMYPAIAVLWLYVWWTTHLPLVGRLVRSETEVVQVGFHADIEEASDRIDRIGRLADRGLLVEEIVDAGIHVQLVEAAVDLDAVHETVGDIEVLLREYVRFGLEGLDRRAQDVGIPVDVVVDGQVAIVPDHVEVGLPARRRRAVEAAAQCPRPLDSRLAR
jgi:membrane protease YdiL (CAAX protease family)